MLQADPAWQLHEPCRRTRRHGRIREVRFGRRWMFGFDRAERQPTRDYNWGRDIWTKALAYDTFARHASYCKGIEFPAIRGKKRKARFEDEE